MGVTLPPNCTGVLQQMAWPKVVLFNSPGSARSNSRSAPWQPRSSYSSCINHGVLLLCKHVSPNLRDVWLLDFLQVGFFFMYRNAFFFFFFPRELGQKGRRGFDMVDTAKSVKSWEVKRCRGMLGKKAGACVGYRDLLKEADVCVNMTSLKLLIDFL